MIELNKAFEVLSDEEKRKMYDAYGEDGPKQQVVQNANFEYVSLFLIVFGKKTSF